MDGDFFTRSGTAEEAVTTVLDWAVSKLLNTFGTGLHTLPSDGRIAVTTRFGEATLDIETLRSAVRSVYSECMPPREMLACCAETLLHADALCQDGEGAILSKVRFGGLRSVWSCLSPDRMNRDDALSAGLRLEGVLPFKVSQAFLKIASWETFGCLMAGLGGGLPRHYFLFMLEAEFTALPIPVSVAKAKALREECASLPAYGQLIERLLRTP
jgi:hypothetical protein